MDEDLKLYIPLGVKPEAELFTGFGKKQLFQALIGSLAMGGVAALVWLFTANVTTTVVLALAGIFGSVMMTTKDQSNLSVVDKCRIWSGSCADRKSTRTATGTNGGLNNVRSHSRLLSVAGRSRLKG